MAHGLSFPYVYAREVIAIGAALPSVCMLIVALRISMRRLQREPLKADDWLAVCALFPMVGMGACLIAGESAGIEAEIMNHSNIVLGARLKNMGYPTPPPPPNLTPAELETWVDPTTRENEIIEFPFQILLMMALGFIKLSIVFFYRRVFVVQKGTKTDIFLVITAVVVALWSLTFILLIIFPCGKHIWINWASGATQANYCPISLTSEYSLAYSDLITDVFIFLLPTFLVWRLQMTTRRKLAVLGIFLLAASAVGASICRIIVYVDDVKASESGTVTDENLNQTLAYFWSMLEAGLALIAACLPPLSYVLTYVRENPSSFKYLPHSWHRSRSQSVQRLYNSTVHPGSSKENAREVSTTYVGSTRSIEIIEL